VSPHVAGQINVVDLNDPGLIAWWFVLSPLRFDLLLAPDPAYRYALWTGVFTVQYAALFATVLGAAQFIRFARDFAGRPRHHGGLVRR